MNNGPTFRQAFERFKADCGSKWSSSTRLAYERRFAALAQFAELPLQTLRLREVQPEIQNIRATAGESTAKAVTYFMNAVCKHAVRRKLLKRHPLRSLTSSFSTSSSVPAAPIHRKDFHRFWSWLLSHAAPAERDFILLMLLAGLPAASVAGLRVADVSVDSWVLRVSAIEHRKRSDQVILHPVSEYVIEHILRPRVATVRDGQVYLLERSGGVPLQSVNKYLRYGSLLRRTGLKVTEKDLRKTAAVLLRRVVYPNRNLARAALTIVPDKHVPMERIREAQERVVEMVFKLVREASA